MSIAWIMFCKALAIGLGTFVAASWSNFRQRRKEQGLPLRYSHRKQAYIVSDWTATVERAGAALKRGLIGVTLAWWAVVAAFLLVYGWHGASIMVQGFLT